MPSKLDDFLNSVPPSEGRVTREWDLESVPRITTRKRGSVEGKSTQNIAQKPGRESLGARADRRTGAAWPPNKSKLSSALEVHAVVHQTLDQAMNPLSISEIPSPSQILSQSLASIRSLHWHIWQRSIRLDCCWNVISHSFAVSAYGNVVVIG